MRVIYIGGYGRSGSSLVDRLCGQRTGGFSGGELCNLFSWAAEGRACTCGEPVQDCQFWRPVVGAATNATGLSLEELALRLGSAEYLRGDTELWDDAWASAFRAIEAQGVSILIDSSKNARFRRRSALIHSLAGSNVELFIHLYRQLPAVVESRLKGNNRLLESGDTSQRDAAPATRAVTNWVFANIYAAWIGSRAADNYVRLSYEDVVRTNGQVLDGILGEHLWDEGSAGGGAGRFHNIAGNRMLRSGSDAINSAALSGDGRLSAAQTFICKLIEAPTIWATGVIPYLVWRRVPSGRTL